MTRLIDADALHKLFGAVTTDLLSKPELSKDFEHMVRAFIMTTKMIEDQPTIDAEPVRHGKWTVTPVYIKCSECGESFMLIPQNYCPNCGARMDERKEE